MLFVPECELTLTKLKPLLTVISSVLNAVMFIEKGYEPQFMALVLPIFMTHYLPPLVANCAAKRYFIDPKCVALNLIGLMLALVVHKQRILLRIIGDLPLLTKVFTFLTYANSRENTRDLITWLIVNELMAIFVRKSLLRKRMTIRCFEAVNSFLCILVLYVVRTYSLNSRIIIASIFGVPVLRRIKNAIMGMIHNRRQLNLKVANIKTEKPAKAEKPVTETRTTRKTK